MNTTQPPNYECAINPGQEPPLDNEYYSVVWGTDPADAAEEAAEIANRTHAEYPSEQIVWVRDIATQVAQRFTVYMERVPSYSAVPSQANAV